MGIFGNSSPFDPDVEKATSENNTSEEWGLIMEICDKAGASTNNAKDCLRSIMKRLANQDPHIVVQAITLLDACVNNCGKTFHLEIASRDFETEYRRILTKAQPPVSNKLKTMLKRWAEGEFKTDPQLNLIPSLVSKLKSEGIDFSDATDATIKKKETARSSVQGVAQKEEEDIARAIELSLQETKNSSPADKLQCRQLIKSLYPSVNQPSVSAPVSAPPEAKKVRALYDFEAVEDNELTFFTGEIIHVIDSTDPNWWKGYNQRGEGLFPANFVTFDLTEPQPKPEPVTRKVQFSDAVPPSEVRSDEAVELDEAKVDRLLSLLHEANPEEAASDTAEMIRLENEVYRMGPLIDQALEKADKQHAQLTQLSADLVDALNLYHTLMREPPPPNAVKHPFPQQAHYPPPQFNGINPYQSLPSVPFYAHMMQQPQTSGSMAPSSSMPPPMPGAPPPQSLAMPPHGALPPHAPPHALPHAPPGQQYSQQPSFAPPGGGVTQSVSAAQGTSQGYVM